MAKTDNLTDFLVDVADAIREKEDSTSAICPQEFNARIRALARLSEAEAVNYTNVSVLLKDIADTIREAEGSNEAINPQDFSERIRAISTDESGVPLYIEALEPITISFANTHQYSKDNSTWSSGTSSTSVSASVGEKVYYRASDLTASTSVGIGAFTISGNCNIGGNIMSMNDGENFIGKITLSKSDAFRGLFLNQTNILDASKLSLPAKTLSVSCYYSMFEGCSNLAKAPKLPAMNLADKCYVKMFNLCKSLVTAPALPATIVKVSCYNTMFNECSSLVNVSDLPAMTMADSCYSNMFQRCISLVTAPALPATILNTYCYNNMFLGCSKLKTAPILPALTLVTNCYRQMIKDCPNVQYIKAMFLTTPSSTYMASWVNGVGSLGTFVKNSAATWSNAYGENAIPSGWSVETASE